MDELTPLTAVTADDPYPYYARLVAERPFYYDERLNAWIASSAAAVDAVLENPAFQVRPVAEPVPKAMAGTALGEVFGRLVRTNEGLRHRALRLDVEARLRCLSDNRVYDVALSCATQLLAECKVLDGALLNGYMFDVPAATMTALVGIDASPQTRGWIRDFACAIAPGSTADDIARGSTAANCLRNVAGGDDADLVANTLGFLFQSYDATAALIGSVFAGRSADEPPIHNTRRFAATQTAIAMDMVSKDQSVLVVLAAAHYDPKGTQSYGFGAGRHSCPGSIIAMSIAKAGVDAFHRAGVRESLFAVCGYQPSLNARIPMFAIKSVVA